VIEENKAQGFIALYRSIETSTTFNSLDVVQQSIAIRLLLHANHKDNEWFDNGQQKMIVIKRGQLITSRASIKKWFNNDPLVTEQRIRTALTKLEKLNFLTKEATKHYTLITICHYNDYQTLREPTNQPSNQASTKEQPSTNQALTTNNHVNHDNHDNQLKDNVEQKPDPIPYREIIEHLNQNTGKAFKHTAAGHKKLIKARWQEGYTLEQFKQVIDNKAAEWLDDPKWSQYLQPSTLFGPKFDQYLNQQNKGRKWIPEKSDEEKMLDELSRQRLASIPVPDASEFPF